ncbi:DUF6958 family protein [Flavobacterium sp.]|uniref:DUF6958 family protein n=1 Tax=Flavobacterium sp. TaxID=239 RepID=UPI0038FC08D1
MDHKIQLKHPTGKKAISMDKEKYGVIEKSLLICLKGKAEVTHKEILNTITEDFKKNKIKFDGSIGWHMEWVKLDLEARKKITRIADTTPIKFKLT